MSPKQGFPLLSNCSTEKAVRRLTIKEQIVSLHSCTAIKLLRGKFSPVISWGCHLGSQRNTGDEEDLASKDLLVTQKGKALIQFPDCTWQGKKNALLKGGLISTLIFSVEGMKSATASDPSETQSPVEDPLFQLDSM